MTGQTLLDFLREQTGTTTLNLSDTVGMRYLNIAYHDVENAIVSDVAEDYFWNVSTTSLVL